MKPTHTLINLGARHTHQNMSLKAVFHTLLYLVAKTSIEATWETVPPDLQAQTRWVGKCYNLSGKVSSVIPKADAFTLGHRLKFYNLLMRNPPSIPLIHNA